MRKTPWFGADTHPVRPGDYDTRVQPPRGRIRARNALGGVRWLRPRSVEIRLYWSGRVWLASRRSKEYTAGLWQQRREWRGLFSHAKRERNA